MNRFTLLLALGITATMSSAALGQPTSSFGGPPPTGGGGAPTGGTTPSGSLPKVNITTFEQYRPWYIAPDPSYRKPRQPQIVIEEIVEPIPQDIAPKKPRIRKPIFRNVPLPEPRPIFVDTPVPDSVPLRTLGRPALLDAPYKPDTIVALIQLDNGKAAQDLADELGMKLLGQSALTLVDAHLLQLQIVPGQSVEAATRLLLADARFMGAHPNYIFEIQQDKTASSPLTALQYAPKRMAIARAHELTRGKDVTIAVIDTGVDLSHGEFAPENFRSFDAVGTPGGDHEPHGTAIAGVIAAGGNMIGMAPEANMLAVRAFAQAEDGRFLSDSYTIARAINWAVVNGADVLNMSFAGPADPLLLKLMDELGRRNILSVAAAGNNGEGAPAAYPAAHPATIAVTATDADDALYPNANRGIYVTVAAPGVDVIAPAPGNTYDLVSGTSIATAHMTGVIALMLSQHHGLKPAEIVSMLSASAEDFGKPGQDPEFGYGFVDAFKATQIAGRTPVASN